MHGPLTSARRLVRIACFATALTAASPAWSAPDASIDAMMQLLAERSLVQAPTDTASPAPSEGLLTRVRERASNMIMVAMNFIGVPYKRGGVSAEGGFDCSGFTRHVFDLSLGLVLPRRAEEQANAAGLVSIDRGELQPGDLVFFNTMRRAFSHVGIYIGGGRFIHAPRSGAEVRTESMGLAYWAERFNGARRAKLTDVAHTGALDPAEAGAAPR
jgi:cell wall-associated NlpC family hydrolase